MPRQLFFCQTPEKLSIVEYDLAAGEDIFLTYTWGREEGPHIERDGKGPPRMMVIGSDDKDEKTTHPFGLRLGTWLIRKNMRQPELEEAEEKLRQAAGATSQVISILERTVEELKDIDSHEKAFLRAYKDHEIIGVQGCGDLTMNLGKVAYINNKLAPSQPTLVALHNEPLNSNTYSCLVKWNGSGGRVTIEEVSFRRPVAKLEPNKIIWVRYGDQWLPRGEAIDFASSHQQVIRNGEVVPVVSICHQFSDLRHLIQMPNLNPKKPLYRGEPAPTNFCRTYFGETKDGDIWFGEEEFLEDKRRNLFRAALSCPVTLELTNGALMDNLRGAFEQAGYREAANLLEPLSPGQWRFIPQNGHHLVQVYFKRNTYSWTMIGLSQDNKRLLSLACKGIPGKSGYTLEQAAEILRQAGACNALLIDEGEDVFQKVLLSGNQFTDLVSCNRGRLRAIFTFARRKMGKNDSPKGAES